MEKIDITLEEISQIFKENGYHSVITDNKIELSLDIKEEEVRLEVIIPEDYPFSFLQVYLKERSSLSFEVAHMIVGNRLCLFEEDSDRHDYKKYSQIAVETLQRAQELLEKSKEKGNLSEYHYEFLDLWGNNQPTKVYSMLDNYNAPTLLDSHFFENKDQEIHMVVKSSQVSLESIVYLCDNLSLVTKKYREVAVYLPMEETRLEKPIDTIQDLYHLLKDESCFPFFLDFLRTHYSSSHFNLIVLGIRNEELPVKSLVALTLPRMVFPKGKVKKAKAVEGIIAINGKKRVKRLSVEDLSHVRVLTRGGAGVADKDVETAYVVGCGSLGSFLSKSLSDTGNFSKLILHDNQSLKSENIGRHLCGVDSMGYAKALAVASRINSNYPAIQIDAYTHSFYRELLGKDENLTKENYDLLVIATGDENIEEQIIQFLESGKIKRPTIIAWVEPFLVAGHALILNNRIDEKTKDYIFDSTGNIKIGIIKNPNQYSRAEAGCQSRFMPYSGFDMQLFTQNLVDYLINRKGLEKKGNYHYCWFGKMKEARQSEIDILPKWRHQDDRSVSICRIDE